MLLMGLIVYVISAVAFPIWYIALGEDIGWQGYLLFPYGNSHAMMMAGYIITLHAKKICRIYRKYYL